MLSSFLRYYRTFLILTALVLLASPIIAMETDNRESESEKQTDAINSNGVTHHFEADITLGYIFPNQGGVTVDKGWAPISYDPLSPPSTLPVLGNDTGREIGSSLGWMYGGITGTYGLTIPMLRGDHGLFEENRLDLLTSLKVNPAADMSLQVKGVLTVLPFLNLFASSSVGVGWVLGDAVSGLAVLQRDSGLPVMKSFNGFVLQESFGGEFMFNLAAVLPNHNKWLNILFTASGIFEYQYYTAASQSDAWVFGVADDYSFNGWEFVSEFFLGYKIPDFPLEIVGVLFDTRSLMGERRNSSTFADGGWGSDFIETGLKLVTIWPMGKWGTIQGVVLFENNIKYSDETVFYEDFRNRQSLGETYFSFKGIQVSYKLKF